MAFSVKLNRAPRPRCVAARAWHKVGSLSELKSSKFSRMVVETESEGKILVQELDGLLPNLEASSDARLPRCTLA